MKFGFLHDFVSLLYPEVCAACGQGLYRWEKTVCLRCEHLLPHTGYELVADNPLARIFWGRLECNAVTACLFFSKEGKTQHLIHELKYKGNRDAGHFLGVELGKSLKNAPLFNDIDFIVPVPLHPKREQKRGYNQSEVIARGMQEVLGTPLSTDNLVRAVATTTQTKKSRQARWENVKDIFVLRNPDQFTNKHILLIDDVITTGSTLEACGLKLKSQTNLRLSIATAACAIS